MESTQAARNSGSAARIGNAYNKMLLNPSYKYAVLLLGLPVHLIVFIIYLIRRRHDTYASAREKIEADLLASGCKDRLRAEIEEQTLRKRAFFGQQASKTASAREIERWTEAEFRKTLTERTIAHLGQSGAARITYADTFASLLSQPLFFALSIILGFPMYLLILVYSNSYLKYIFERLIMSLFVIIGVAVLVFTLLHLSPLHPAANILGETATEEQIASFNKLYGLDQPYLVQLWNTMKGIATFDLGKSFSGNEEVTSAIAGKFPITLQLTVISLLLAVIIALPIGIISAARPNSFFDYTFIFIALIGLSIPNFWQGLIFILNFSIKLQWLPATYNPQNWLSMIMPVVVLGTGLTAAVARMTRSSTLEVIHEDYILTARAKGLSQRQVLLRHAVTNALIPVITVIGLQFGGMLGGAAVTEKVFNISGIGSYIVDKQFIPDIPSIMGGVVYTAITISLVNMLIDILYAFCDPRIRSKMKQY
ncbi:ABC transporter permease [Paenibacillus thiaminolyticus]|uniref:ABC transporter permease n=1 Tax=Paenibacillus thiaminolyticus TaxID=49283 RepID=UPI0023301B26|nr:ABC transporter permease [Paenibacillus thiaminolyticus]WCF05992.1 ABC transporter permease [Paenibacillus thiaminolyticus]